MESHRAGSEAVSAHELSRADKALFDRIARDYVSKDLKECCRVARRQRLRQTLRSLPVPMGRILEVGCGGGFTAQYLEGLFESYTGVDHSAELIRYAQAHNGGPNRAFVCSDILDFRTGDRFDLILMIGVLHPIPEPRAALEKLRGLLSPHGVVAVNEPQSGNPLVSALRWVRKRVDSNYSSDQVEFSEPEIVRLFEDAGYTCESHPQGVLSTPFAETQPLPQALALPLARLATAVDPLLEDLLATSRLGRLAWNTVVVGRPA